MDRRTALSALVALLFVLVFAVGCEGQGSNEPEGTPTLPAKKHGVLVQEITLRIGGMT